jgi:hypothetical protein
MKEEIVEIKFEREDRDGIVAVGTYVSEAARRLGIELGSEQFGDDEAAEDFLVVKIIKGGEFLSAPTQLEIEKLTDERRATGERLASHAKIERPGEIIVMSTEKKVEEKPSEEKIKEDYRKEFQELPLEKKIASLVELESIALSETFAFIINSPYLVVGKVMDVLAEFGWAMEADAKKQSRPAEHHSEEPPPPSVTEEKKTTDSKEPPPPSV